MFVFQKKMIFKSQFQVFYHRIVKVDDVFIASPVFIQRFCFWSEMRKIRFHLLGQDVPVAVAPAVNRLFYIAHQQVVVALRQCVGYKRFEIFPLQRRRVLEFVEHKIVKKVPDLFVNKRRLAFADNPAQQQVGVGELQHSFFVEQCFYLFLQIGQNSEHTQLAVYRHRRKILRRVFTVKDEDFV